MVRTSGRLRIDWLGPRASTLLSMVSNRVISYLTGWLACRSPVTIRNLHRWYLSFLFRKSKNQHVHTSLKNWYCKLVEHQINHCRPIFSLMPYVCHSHCIGHSSKSKACATAQLTVQLDLTQDLFVLKMFLIFVNCLSIIFNVKIFWQSKQWNSGDDMKNVNI